jgi:fructokinase
MTFLVCGEAVIDLFGSGSARELSFTGFPAGSPFNVCVGLSRLGHKASLLTGISTDAFGRVVIDAMEREGVDWSLAPRTNRPTVLSFVLPMADGSPDYAFYGERGAATEITDAALPSPLPAAVKAIHIGSFPMAVEPAKTAYAALIRREADTRFISLDPNVRPALIGDMGAFAAHFAGLCRSAALIKASTEDLALMHPGEAVGEIAARWRSNGAAVVVITDGLKGASAWTNAGVIDAPTKPVHVVDTVGAGDSFMSGLLAALAERGLLERGKLANASAEHWHDMLGFANAAAGLTCQRRGADPPGREEVERLLR